jgi:hypothetical protein
MPIRLVGAGRDLGWTTRTPLFGAPARRRLNRPPPPLGPSDVRTISIGPLVVWRSRERLPSADRLRNGSPTGNDDLVRTALRICLQPQHLRRTLTIAAVVGTILTAINQADVIVRGEATSTTVAKAVLNYLVPFIVSNLGLLVGARDERG